MTPENPALGGDSAGYGDVRHYLDQHVDPAEKGSSTLAAVYLSGRADLVADIADGLTKGRSVEEILEESAAADDALAGRFGLNPYWGVGEPPPQEAPALKSVLELRDLLNEDG